MMKDLSIIMEYRGVGLNKLRFKGHTEPWGQKKLEDVATIDGGYAFQSKDYTEQGARVIRISDVQSGFISDKDAKFVNSSLMSSKLDNYELFNKDIVMSLTGIVGRVARINETHTPCYLNQRVARVKTLNNSDNKFIYSLLNNSSFEQVALKNATGGAQKNMKTSWLNNYKIPFPSLPEQEKIGGFLSALDERLRVQSELVDLLALEYTGYSQRIFNQTLRFKDENGNQYPDWEQKKLGEVATFSRGKGLPKSELSKDGTMPCVHYGELFASPVDFEPVNRTSFTKDKNYSVAGDILMPSSDVTKDGLAKASVIKESGVILGGDINIVRLEEGNDSIFWAHQIKHYKREIIKKVTGTAVKHFYTKELAKIEYYQPSLPEQVKIGGFLSALSARIEAERALLTQYKEQKKAYLQKLLP